MNALVELQREIEGCTRCPRLVEHCRSVAAVKRRAYADQDYWSRPVPSFGDPAARLLIVGLAPGAHGANRTGRMFTGDRSGEWLYRAMHETGFASQASSTHASDGLSLRDAWITASAHCAPPDNKPAREEIAACRTYLARELDLLGGVKVVVALGRIAFDNYLDALRARGLVASRSAFLFAHDRAHALTPVLISSYHPSQQNTATGKLTAPMLRAVFEHARRIIEG